MNYYSADRDKADFDRIREEGIRQGLDVGFKQLSELYSFKQGFPLFIYGMPHCGKSEFTFEILIQLSMLYGKKHFVFSPEAGDGNRADVYTELAEKYMRKPIRKRLSKDHSNKDAMSESESAYAFQFVRDHFYAVGIDDFPEKVTLSDVYAKVRDAEVNGGWTFDTVLIDPWTEISMDSKVWRDTAVSEAIGAMRKNDRDNAQTTIVTVHTQDIKPIFKASEGIVYYPIPQASQIAGGQMWFRRGFTIIGLYRPSVEVYDAQPNELWVYVQKAKPKGVGRTGKVSWFWDNNQNRYYEDVHGTNSYGRGQVVVRAKKVPEIAPEDVNKLNDNDSQPEFNEPPF